MIRMGVIGILLLVGVGCPDSSDKVEASIQKRCLAGGCVDDVVQCMEINTPEPYKRDGPMADIRCQWLMDNYEQSPCRSTCGTCSEGPDGAARMLRMVKTLLSCSQFR